MHTKQEANFNYQGVRFGPHQYEFYDQINCGNCGLRGHAIRTCMGPITPQGFVEGCPLCNDKSHNYEDCFFINRDDFMTELFCIIGSRADRPPLFFSQDFRTVRGFHDVPLRPWTREFARYNQEYWRQHVYRKDPWTENTIRDPTWDIGWYIVSQAGSVIRNWGPSPYVHQEYRQRDGSDVVYGRERRS
jgi:hypothetical protein